MEKDAELRKPQGYLCPSACSLLFSAFSNRGMVPDRSERAEGGEERMDDGSCGLICRWIVGGSEIRAESEVLSVSRGGVVT